jgi:hypothetical protein
VVGNGYQWLSGVLDHAGRLLLVVGLLAGPLLAALVLVWKAHASGWIIPAAVGVLLLYALFEGAFQTYRDALPRSSALQAAPAAGLTARHRPVAPLPGRATHVVISAFATDRLVLSQGTLIPLRIEGDLPLRVEMEGVSGTRQGQPNNKPTNPWLWMAKDVQLVNASDDVLVTTVWLVPHGQNLKRTEQLRSDGDVLRIEPHGNCSRSFSFLHQPGLWREVERMNPPETWPELELVFLEIGTTRQLRITFHTVPIGPPVPTQ